MFLIFFTLVILPCYLILRCPFFKLPLHIDTGFYVSNNTICERKIDFSKGWNATFAGCSKVVPEFFYSLIYLIHGGTGYKKFSRFYFSLYNYLTAIAIGYTMYILGQESVFLYCTGLVTFCLISSEPHYGVYYECGEQFEILPQIIGFLLIILGIDRGDVLLLTGGIGLWALESYFVKLSSLPATIILAVGIGIFYPKSIPYLIASLMIASGIYLLWVLVNKKNTFKMIRALIGHEVHLGHRVDIRDYINQFTQKNRFLWDILCSHPILPALVLVGFVSGNSKLFLIIIYLFAVWGAYLIQVSPIWYYTIPFQPIIACLAALGVGVIVNIPYGYLLVGGLLSLWLLMHLRKAYGLSYEQLNRWTWQPHGSSMCDKNLMLEEIVPEMRSLVQGQSLFVFGAWNQAYTLLETSYNTNIISAYNWLDTMNPGWVIDLNKQFVKDPPSFILDSDNCFYFGAVRDKLGLSYRLLKVWGDQQFRLLRLESVIQEISPDLKCRSYRDINKIVDAGSTFLQKGEYIEAEEKFNEALSMEEVPETSKVFAHYNLGSIYEREGDLNKAKDKFVAVLALSKEVNSSERKKLLGNAHFHLGCIYQALGEREKAEMEFENCLELIPEHKKARENLTIL